MIIFEYTLFLTVLLNRLDSNSPLAALHPLQKSDNVVYSLGPPFIDTLWI